MISGIFGRIWLRLTRFSTRGGLDENDLVDLGITSGELNQLNGSRPEVRQQLIEMAGKFNVREADLDATRWRALEIIHACDSCQHSKACYQYLANGKSDRFDTSDCPNAARYSEIAAEAQQA